MNLPDYVNRPTGYDLALRGPYLQQGVTMRCYAIKAQKNALSAMCERYLNGPANQTVRYTPFSSHVMVVFADMPRVSAADPSLGYMHEIDVSIFVPVLRHTGNSILPDGIAVFMPYLFVNNDWALITGREGGLGFRKNLGLSFSDQVPDLATADSATSGGARFLNHVEAWTINQRGNDSKLQRQRLIELTGDKHDANVGDQHASPGDLFKHVLEKMLGSLAEGLLDQVLHLMISMNPATGIHMPVVYLRQYRDAVQGDKAVLQSVFESKGFFPLNTYRGGGFLDGDHQISFANPVSHPIADELGVAADTALPVEFAFELDCDFMMDIPR